MSTRILILGTGNSCRSQMTEGFLKSFDFDLVVFSAGTAPSIYVEPIAVQVMREVKLDISDNFTKNVNFFIHKSFDYIITVSKIAEETCPEFFGKIGNKVNFSFKDPSLSKGMPYEIFESYRKVRDEIKIKLHQFYLENIYNSNREIKRVNTLLEV